MYEPEACMILDSKSFLRLYLFDCLQGFWERGKLEQEIEEQKV